LRDDGAVWINGVALRDNACVWQVHVIIQEIFLNGAVHKDGRLFPGDQIVSVSRR